MAHCAGFIDRNFEQVANFAQELDTDRIIVPICKQKLSSVTYGLCDKTKQLIAVGGSAGDFTAHWQDVSVTGQRVVELGVTKVRDDRKLVAEVLGLDGVAKCFVDDVVVSGLTLAAARQSAGPSTQDEAVAGMEFDSKTQRKRLAMPLRSAVQYKQIGGGKPAVNSLSTFASLPERAEGYSLQRFGTSEVMDELMSIYTESEMELT